MLNTQQNKISLCKVMYMYNSKTVINDYYALYSLVNIKDNW